MHKLKSNPKGNKRFTDLYVQYFTVTCKLTYEQIRHLIEMNQVFPEERLSDIVAIAVDLLYLFLAGDWHDVYETIDKPQ
jgi:hypothetical protein